MKKRISALLLCVLMVFAMFSMAACKSDSGTDSPTTKPSGDKAPTDGNVSYQVTVVNGVGQPYTEGMIVTFISADGKENLAPINAEGVASKEMAAGEYTVKVTAMDSSVVLSYDETAKVTADAPTLELAVAYEMGEAFETIYAESITMEGQLSYDAYMVNTGSTHVTVSAEDRNYFLFVPAEAGKYQFSVSGDAGTVGIYGGSTHFIMADSTAEVVDGKATTNISADMIGTGNTGTTVLVIGVDVNEGVTDCILNVIRVGDVDWTVEQEPWITYQPKQEIKDYTLPEGVTLKKFDLTAATDTYKLVLNEQDGCYHLNTADGPLVFVQLEEAMYGISMLTMVGEIVYADDGTLMESGTAPFRYMYDNGPDDFFKEDYTDAMRQYVTCRDDASGVYPLTADLYYLLPKGIEQNGWCRSDTVNYLFASETGINNDIAWMFLLMYEDAPLPEIVDPDNTEDPSNPENPGITDNPGVTENPGTTEDPTTPTTKPTTPTTKPTNPTTKPADKPVVDPPESDPVEDNKDNPIIIGSTLSFDAEVKANHIVYFDLMKVNDLNLTIKSKDAYVIYNGKTYEAKNGTVTVYGLYSEYTNVPVKIAIGNKGTSDATFAVKMSYPGGHRENPYTYKLGTNTTECAAGNDQGVFYTFKATKNGTLTIKLDSVSGSAKAGITITKVINSIPTQIALEEGADTVTIEVKSGDKLEINIGTLPNAKHKYPAATIKTTATIE